MTTVRTEKTTVTNETPAKSTRSPAKEKKVITFERVMMAVLIILLGGWMIYEAVQGHNAKERVEALEAAAAKQKEINAAAGKITQPPPPAAIVPPAQSKQEAPPKGKAKSREAPSKRIYVEPVSKNSVESKESLTDTFIVTGATGTARSEEVSLLDGVDEKWTPQQPREQIKRQAPVNDWDTRYSYRRYGGDYYRRHNYRQYGYDQGYYVQPVSATFSDGPVVWGKKVRPQSESSQLEGGSGGSANGTGSDTLAGN